VAHLLIAAAVGYLLGSIPWGYLLPRFVAGIDIRTVGSGNMGAANVWRSVGLKAGIAVALLDVAKGFVPTLIGLWLGGEWAGLVGGIAAMVGHYRPLFLGFARGGKTVATTGGVVLALAPLAAVCAGVVWIAVLLASRYTSVASLSASLALPLFCIIFGAPWAVVGFTAGAAVAIIFLHRANIGRLRRRNENRIQLGRRNVAATGHRSHSSGSS
jgi:glycerol-3-phosphate acyltransferase PlsY